MFAFNFRAAFMAAAAAALFTAGPLSAATFTISAIDDAINPGDSGVETSSSFGLSFCAINPDSCLTATLAPGLDGRTFDLNNVGDSATFDFLTFTVGDDFNAGLLDTYDVSAQLAFSSPSTSVLDTGGALTFLNLGSFFLVGDLAWDSSPITTGFGNGGLIEVSFQQGTGLLRQLPVTTTATVELVRPEVVPLPAAGWLLIAGIGGLAALKRRQKAVA